MRDGVAPDALCDHGPEYAARILVSVKAIAMVGASVGRTGPSHAVLRVLHEAGSARRN